MHPVLREKSFDRPISLMCSKKFPVSGRLIYKGSIAKQIVKGIQDAGGILTLEDLSTYQPKFRKPLRGEFNGFEIVSMPPPSSGGAIVIQLMGYAERADRQGAFKDGFGSIAAIHAILHGMAHAFADRPIILVVSATLSNFQLINSFHLPISINNGRHSIPIRRSFPRKRVERPPQSRNRPPTFPSSIEKEMRSP